MTIQSVLHEIQREHNMRKFVFPKLQRDGKLTPTEAVHRQTCLECALKLFAAMAERGLLTVDEALILIQKGELPIHIKGGSQVETRHNFQTTKTL